MQSQPNHTGIADDAFGSLLKSTLRGCPPDPLFTRKVLNMLPDARRRHWARTEYSIYIVALIITLIYASRYFSSLIASGRFEMADIAPTAMFAALLTAVLYSLIAPFTLTIARSNPTTGPGQ